MPIGQNIRAWRKQRGLTQRQLGALCGVSGASIGSYEKGDTVLKRRVVEKIAAALDVPADRLTENAVPAAQRGLPGAVPLYDGVLAALRELYGFVEGRTVLGENGANKTYYIVRDSSDSFILYDRDIAAIARSVQESMAPLVERLNSAGRGA